MKTTIIKLFAVSLALTAGLYSAEPQKQMAPAPAGGAKATPAPKDTKVVQPAPTAKPAQTTAPTNSMDDEIFKISLEQKKVKVESQISVFIDELIDKQMEELRKIQEEKKKAAEDRQKAAEERKNAEDERKLAQEERIKIQEERKKDIQEREKIAVNNYEQYKLQKYLNLTLDGKLKHPQMVADLIKYFEADESLVDSESKDILIKKLKSIQTAIDKKEVSIEDGINYQKYLKWTDAKSKIILVIEEKEKNQENIKDIIKFLNNDPDVDGKVKDNLTNILKDNIK